MTLFLPFSMKNLKQYLPGILILILFFTVSLLVYSDYGISFDELIQHEIGDVNYKYVFENDNTLDTYLDREYGVGFELPLIIIEKVFNIKKMNHVYTMRHIATHTLFLLCMFAGYILSIKLFKNQLVAIATLLMLLLSPRIYAHSYFNTKDIPSLSIVVLCLLTTYNALEKKSILSYAIAGIICGFGIGLRLMNMIIAAPLIGYLLLDIVRNIKNYKLFIQYFISLLLFISLGWLVLLASWPALWKDPYISIVEFYKNLSKFRWDGSVLLNGQIIRATELPWYYIPQWFTITVPLFWQILCLSGIFIVLYKTIKKPFSILDDANTRLFMMAIFCFIGPVVAVIYLKAVLYDDWRHLYFIYPSFVFLAAFALNELMKTKLKIPAISLFVIQLVSVLFFVIKYHPNQNVYFNELESREQDHLMRKYELDYWQHSYKQGLKWVAANSDKETIFINKNLMLLRNFWCLEPELKKRFVYTEDESQLDYYLEVFRTDPYKYSREESIHEIKVLGSPILRIRKMK